DALAREETPAIWLAAWLALPLVIAVVWGLYQCEPGAAWVCGPALIITTLAALLHGSITRATLGPATGAQRAAIPGRSLLVGLIAGLTTFAATIAVLAVMLALVVASILALIAKCFGVV
ncbi:MAG: hypothetical protein KDA41_20905, partial [Planctomycetales bacterium]|nr:hypothetical protein [Planctomycetales bacterium]